MVQVVPVVIIAAATDGIVRMAVAAYGAEVTVEHHGILENSKDYEENSISNCLFDTSWLPLWMFLRK